MKSLISWGIEQGAVLDALEFVDDLDKLKTQRSVKASHDLKVGDQVAFIPSSAILSETVCNQSIVGLKIDAFLATHPEAIKLLNNHGKYVYGIAALKMAVFMVYERYQKRGHFFEYLQALPLQYTLPLCWPQDQMDSLLKGTDLWHLTMEKKKWLVHALDIAKKACWEVFSRDVLSEENLVWAYSAISSRAFPKIISSPTGSRNEICMWPILDLMDHDHASKMEWQITDTGITFVTQEPIARGNVVFNNYGPKGNENLLSNYGFVIEGNPYDYVKVTVNAKNDNDEQYERKQEILCKLETNELRHLLFKDDVSLPQGLLGVTRLLLSNDWELQAFKAENLKRHLEPISIRNELASIQSLITLMNSKLQSLPSLDMSKCHENLATTMSRIYRSSQEGILTLTLQNAMSHLEDQLAPYKESADSIFLTLENPWIDPIFLDQLEVLGTIINGEEDWDEDTYLALILVHERHRGSDSYWHPFFEGLASNPAYASFVNHQDNEAERSYFQAQVLPILDLFLSDSSLDLEHLRSVDTFAWATSLLSTHGGFWPGTESFGVFLK